MFLISLYFFVFFNLFLHGKCSIPVQKLCVNEACDAPISEAISNAKYNAPESGVLSFTRDQKMLIYSKGKNQKDYWEAVINGKKGYVPSNLVTEKKVLHSTDSLIPVTVSETWQNASFAENTLETPSDRKIETEELNAAQQSKAVLSNSNHINNSNAVKKQIKPSEALFTVVEGTTIYTDESHEINPSVTVEMKSTRTAAPINANVNKKPAQHQERATIPPEVINLNSDFRQQNMAGNFKIETVEEDDNNIKIETREVDVDADEEDEDDEQNDENEDENDAEGLEDDEENDDTNDELNDAVPESPEVGRTAKATSQNMGQKEAASSAATPSKGFEQRGEPVLQNMGQRMVQAPAPIPQPATVGTAPLKVEQRGTHEAGFVSEQSPSQNLGEKTVEPHSTTPQGSVRETDEVKQQMKAEFPATDVLNTVSATPQPPTTQTTAEAPSQNVGQKEAASSAATPPKGFEQRGEPVLQNMGQRMVQAPAPIPQPATVGTAPLKVEQQGMHEAGFVSKQSPSQNLGEKTVEPHSTTPQGSVRETDEVKQQMKAEFPATGVLNTVSATPQPPTTQTTAEAPSQNVGQKEAASSAATPPKGFEQRGEPVLQNMGQRMFQVPTPIPQPATVGTAPLNVEQRGTHEAGFDSEQSPSQKLGEKTAERHATTPQAGFASGPNGAPQNLLTETYPTTPEAAVGIIDKENLNSMEQKKAEAATFTPQSGIATGSNTASQNFEQKLSETNTKTPYGGARISAEVPLQNAGQAGIYSPAELTSAGADLETPLLSIKEKVTENPSAPQQVPLNAGFQNSDSIMSGSKSDEIPKAMPSPDFEKTSTTFSEFSVLADSSPKDTENFQKPSHLPGTVGEKPEVTTEAYATTFQPPSKETGSEFSQTTNKRSIAPDTIPEKVGIAAEAQVMSEGRLPKDDPKETENSQIPENNAEEPGMLSQITGMFSSWFTSSPGEVLTEDKVNHEAFQDLRADEKAEAQIESVNEAPLGTCPNSELGFDCKDFSIAEEQRSFWSDWIPAGLGLESVLTQSNTVVYLIVTAVTVLLFTLGHNFIEKRGKTGPLIAKINKLEHELLVTSKECVLLKDEIHAAKEKITLYENSANDELVISLQAELEESKKVKAELESSIEVLQQELDAATEAGLDLNKMLSEVLTQKGGSETLLKSVENLQAQLDSQQKVIDEMTKKLGVKNQENEALQLALQSANEKSENLEEQLTDIKHNLNLHLKEKEDVTRDLNARINQLVSCTNQLWESKEEETSKFKAQLEELQKKLDETVSALTVKEEEVKALKQSMKHLKGKGDVKLETVFDFSRIKAELAKEAKENQVLLEKLQKEESSRKALSEKLNELESEMQKMKKNFEEAEQKKEEAEKKLEVLSTYFKEKETQLQKELGLQEALWAQKKGDENAVCNMMKSLQEEVESYKSQNETLKKEIVDQERGLKNQIAGLEQKAHENWVAARQAERKLEEAKQEMSQLRNKLVSVMEKNSNNVDGKGNIRSTEELNGVEAASPILHETSSPLLFPPLPLDPNSTNLLPPGFMPPPMFMPPPIGGFMPPPPFLPGDRRPPPLGRMSSPPLNNRFSPSSLADYPFERMSSPPLSPPGSNYRSLNDDRDHYRHRTPPYPPPLHPRNWDDSNEIPGFVPISSQRDSRRDHKGSNVSSEHSSSESLDKSSRPSGRV